MNEGDRCFVCVRLDFDGLWGPNLLKIVPWFYVVTSVFVLGLLH